MSEEHRDRAEGWKHAKLSGHENESKLESLMESNHDIQQFFLDKIGKPNCKITHVDVGGLFETNVPCIFDGETTKSKTDMHVVLSDGSKYNISIKKSLAGQVYLINANRFIKGFEIQYHTTIPSNVKRAIMLFWGYADDTESIVKAYGTKLDYETRKHRLVGDTLKKYDKSLYNALLDWFKDNAKNIADFCFSKGLAKNSSDWADIVWYRNLLGENQVNDIYFIDDMTSVLEKHARQNTEYGSVGGGTTIQLPFGFVQWHSPTKKIPGDMQFHHNHEKVASLWRK